MIEYWTVVAQKTERSVWDWLLGEDFSVLKDWEDFISDSRIITREAEIQQG